MFKLEGDMVRKMPLAAAQRVMEQPLETGAGQVQGQDRVQGPDALQP